MTTLKGDLRTRARAVSGNSDYATIATRLATRKSSARRTAAPSGLRTSRRKLGLRYESQAFSAVSEGRSGERLLARDHAQRAFRQGQVLILGVHRVPTA